MVAVCSKAHGLPPPGWLALLHGCRLWHLSLTACVATCILGPFLAVLFNNGTRKQPGMASGTTAAFADSQLVLPGRLPAPLCRLVLVLVIRLEVGCFGLISLSISLGCSEAQKQWDRNRASMYRNKCGL